MELSRMGWGFDALRFAFYLLTLLAAFLQPRSTEAYPFPVDFSGQLLRWQIDASTPDLTYQVEFEGSFDESLLITVTRDAASKWNEVPSSFVVLNFTNSLDADIRVVFKQNDTGDDFAAGFAVFEEYDGNTPVRCRIEVFLEDIVTVGVAKTILHEFGHCLGLGHSLVPEAIMSYRVNENQYALSLNDYAALTTLYPRPGFAEDKKPLGCSVVPDRIAKASPSRSLVHAAWLVALLSLPWALTWWKRTGYRTSSRTHLAPKA